MEEFQNFLSKCAVEIGLLSNMYVDSEIRNNAISEIKRKLPVAKKKEKASLSRLLLCSH